MSQTVPSEVDRERQRPHIRLEVRIYVRVCVSKPHNGGINAGLRENAFGEPCRQLERSLGGNVEYFELGANTNTARMGSTAQRSCCALAAFVCIKRDFAVISSISDFSVATFLSASFSVTPNHRVNTMSDFLRSDCS